MKVIPIETVVNIYDQNIKWAELGPDFNGYQISTTGLIRSMKFYKKYPYGILIEPDKSGNVKLSNSLNQVEQVNINDELKKARFWRYNTCDTYIRSRNPVISSKSKYLKDKKANLNELKKPSGFHFTTID